MSNLRYFGDLNYGGHKGIEVMVDPTDNSLFLSSRTIENILQYEEDSVRKKFGAKSLKAFAGEPLASGKNLKGTDALGRENRMKAIPFETFITLVYFEGFHGKSPHKEIAQGLLMSGLADSFRSIILEQCGIKLSLGERQVVITRYLEGYHAFQDWVRDTHLQIYKAKPSPDYYRAMAVMINNYLFDRDHFQKDRVGNASKDELRRLENFQIAFMDSKTFKKGGDPIASVQVYINGLSAL